MLNRVRKQSSWIPDGNIYASFGNTLYKFDAMGNILSEQTFSAEILATSLSPDSTRLALTIRGSSTGEDSTFILVEWRS